MTYTQQTLEIFSLKHYTYINQIFGDKGVREIISEVFPHESLEFRVETANENFEIGSEHHILYDKLKMKNICSVVECHQNILKNVNDTLCQSYSLMTYFGKKISRIRKDRQRSMCNMYRDLMNNEEFIEKLEYEILNNTSNKKLWQDFTKTKKTYLNTDIDCIRENIKDVLDKWEEYGYMYFMDEGKCR
jgi:hypothetical protein